MGKDYCEDCRLNAIRKGCAVLPCGQYVKPYIATKNGLIKVLETWQMVIPLQDNQGKPFPKKLVDVVRADVLRVFPGDTEVKAVGSWKQGQRIYVDRNVRIEVDVCAGDHDKAEAYMADAKRTLKTSLKQEKIYVTYSLSRFEFLLPEEFFSDIGVRASVPESLDQAKVDLYLALVSPSK